MKQELKIDFLNNIKLEEFLESSYKDGKLSEEIVSIELIQTDIKTPISYLNTLNNIIVRIHNDNVVFPFVRCFMTKENDRLYIKCCNCFMQKNENKYELFN